MTSDDPFVIVEPVSEAAPFVLSIPHCGVEFPTEVADRLEPSMTKAPDDTDWHLDRLYDFAPELGVTMIHARYSRWVIDLNREPEGRPLYDDGRIITELCPTTDFLGDLLYLDPDEAPDDTEKERRLEAYYRPYHSKIDEVISDLRAKFDNVIFWDGHSIRRLVPSIRPEPFPDLILGDNDGKTASRRIIDSAVGALSLGRYRLNHNDPFRGGYLTRSKGDPSNGVHGLQLEMSKDLYMDATETEYDENKAAVLKAHLQAVFERLIDAVSDEL
ncbi:MAG: N-formylglutamate amidohydrolase [Acidobacteriota bacterium]|nr:MAG: N-formylglutamate amidohydrolase [Acidobacteriota bacterium]